MNDSSDYDASSEEDGSSMEEDAYEEEIGGMTYGQSLPGGILDDPITVDEVLKIVERLKPLAGNNCNMVTMTRHVTRFSRKLTAEKQIETRRVLTEARPAVRAGAPGTASEPSQRVLTPCEIVLIANLCPRGGDEAVELVPTLGDLATLGDLGPDHLESLVKKIG